MNDITDVIFIFVFAFVLFYYEIINIKDNLIVQKLYLFAAVMFFALLLDLVKATHTKYKSNIQSIISNVLYVGLFTYIGHTLYFDMIYSDNTKIYVDKTNSYMSPEITICILVALSIAVGKSLRYMFATKFCEDMMPFAPIIAY